MYHDLRRRMAVGMLEITILRMDVHTQVPVYNIRRLEEHGLSKLQLEVALPGLHSCGAIAAAKCFPPVLRNRLTSQPSLAQ